jgi:hypothetical protein
MEAPFLISLSWLSPSRRMPQLILLLGNPLTSWSLLPGFPLPNVPSRLILTLQSESIFLLKLIVVCRDHSGRILKASSQISPSCDLNYGEALVAQLTLSLAATLQLKNFTLESDSQIVIFALNFHAITFDWHIKHVIANSLSMFLASTFWEARKVKRRANFFTHHVTHWAAARGFSGCIPISILFFLLLLSSPVMVLASGLTMQPVSTTFQ